jgi:hypothetical protein
MLERMGQILTKHGNDFDGKGKNLGKAATKMRGPHNPLPGLLLYFALG